MNSGEDVKYGAVLHQQSYPAVCSSGDQEILVAPPRPPHNILALPTGCATRWPGEVERA
ncbi:MAG: hypothetical protein ACJ797_03820 [Ktedonobacteraceae bacterium]